MVFSCCNARQEALSWFHRSAIRRERVVVLLEAVSDIERLINKVRGFGANPRDLVGLARSLEAAPQIKAILAEDDDADKVSPLAQDIRDSSETVELIRNSCRWRPGRPRPRS